MKLRCSGRHAAQQHRLRLVGLLVMAGAGFLIGGILAWKARPANQKDILKLVRALQEGDTLDKHNAAVSLSLHGQEGVSALVDVLTDSAAQKKSRVMAAEALAQLGPKARSAVPAFLEVFKDESDIVASWAASLLLKLEPEDDVAIPAFVDALRTGGPLLRVEAVHGLRRVGKDGTVVAALREALRDPEMNVRQEAIEALATFAFQDETVVPALAESLKDMDASVRIAAARALKRLGANAKSAVPALHDSLKDSNERVRKSAAEALEAIESEKR